jgi:DNA-binding MarR family transcriptional regulator
MITVIQPKSELALELGHAMADLKNQLRRRLQQRIRESGLNLTFEMLEVLACLGKQDGINQQEIADLTLRDKSGMTYLIDNLSKRGMVVRVEDESDRRNKLIYLTDKGRATREEIKPWAAELYGIASHDVDTATLEDTLQLIRKMTENIKA